MQVMQIDGNSIIVSEYGNIKIYHAFTDNLIGAKILHGTGTPFNVIFKGLYHNK